VACFLTRGDLYQHWEEVSSVYLTTLALWLLLTRLHLAMQGAKVFELWLLDADWALNTANWQWLSCSNFFYQVRSETAPPSSAAHFHEF